MAQFSIDNETRASIPRASFRAMKAIKEAALGKAYTLNLAFVNPTTIRKLNKVYRGLDEATDILSFPLSKAEGEMYICPSESRREAQKFERTYENFLLFLFIHGCVHLKGHDHGGTMERIEVKLRKKFKI